MAIKIQGEWSCLRCGTTVDGPMAHGGLDCPKYVSHRKKTVTPGWSMIANMPKDLAHALRHDKMDLRVRDMGESVEIMRQKYRTKHWTERANWSNRDVR